MAVADSIALQKLRDLWIMYGLVNSTKIKTMVFYKQANFYRYQKHYLSSRQTYYHLKAIFSVWSNSNDSSNNIYNWLEQSSPTCVILLW